MIKVITFIDVAGLMQTLSPVSAHESSNVNALLCFQFVLRVLSLKVWMVDFVFPISL